jgi:hypothetical protein
MHTDKTEPLVCFVRDRQNLVGPRFGVTIERDIAWQSPAGGLFGGKLINQLSFSSFDCLVTFFF